MAVIIKRIRVWASSDRKYWVINIEGEYGLIAQFYSDCEPEIMKEEVGS